MSDHERVATYLVRTRPGPTPHTGSSGRKAQIEAIFTGLGLPWKPDDGDDGNELDWQIDSDVGVVGANIDPVVELLNFTQSVGDASDSAKNNADLMELLLQINAISTGSFFAVDTSTDGSKHWALLGRVPLAALSREVVERMLGSFLYLSSLVDRIKEGTLLEHLEQRESERTAAHASGERRAPDGGAATGEGPVLSSEMPADWYPDPHGEARLRYWDGRAWTAHTSA